MDRYDLGGLHLCQEGACFHRTRGRKLANAEGLDLYDLRLREIVRAQSDTSRHQRKGRR